MRTEEDVLRFLIEKPDKSGNWGVEIFWVPFTSTVSVMISPRFAGFLSTVASTEISCARDIEADTNRNNIIR